MKRIEAPKTTENKIGYVLFLPDDYSKENTYPMITYLHGAGERENGKGNLLDVCVNAFPSFFMNGTLELPAIVLCPQCPKDTVWNHIIFDLKALMLSVADEYGADHDRLSVTGLSMGGFGTWEAGMCFPELLSAIAPICGGGMAWRTGALKNMPIWAFHGSIDSVVAPSNSEDMVKTARINGANVKYTVFDGVGHDAWTPAYKDTKVIEWLLSQRLSDRKGK